MATVYRCDRCQEITNIVAQRLSVSEEIPVHSAQYRQTRDAYDLCAACSSDLTTWVNTLPKQLAKE